LVQLDGACSKWIDGETDADPHSWNIFIGETLGRAFATEDVNLPAVLHYVYEWNRGEPRYSMPYFMRGRPNAVLGESYIKNAIAPNETETIKHFVENTIMTTARPWAIRPGKVTDY